MSAPISQGQVPAELNGATVNIGEPLEVTNGASPLDVTFTNTTIDANITGQPIEVTDGGTPLLVDINTTPVPVSQSEDFVVSVTGDVSVTSANSASIDAFGHQRVSIPYTVFDAKQTVDNAPLFWDDAAVSGSGTSSTYNTNQASTTIAVSNATAGVRVRQTKMHFLYQPGKSQLIIMTAVLGAKSTGIIKRLGQFDDNNGVFFETSGTTLSVVIRTNTSGSPTDSGIPQSSWNVDKLDGTGASGITLDTTKTQIFFMDYEWLGVGRVRFGFFLNGMPIICHTVDHANSNTTVYMSTPNLPLRYEVRNNGSGPAASLTHICSSVLCEGGVQETGKVVAIDRGTTGFTTLNTTDTFPLMSFRLKSTHLEATVLPTTLDILCTSNANFRWALLLNPTIAGVDAASWTDVTNSSLQYDVSRTTTNIVSGGFQIASGYGSTSVQNILTDLKTFLRLGAKINGTRDELVLAIQRLSGTTETFYSSVIFRDII